MKISEEKLQEELLWQKELYTSDKNSLENKNVDESKIPLTYYSLGNSIRNIGVCDLLLGKDKEKSVEKFGESAKFFLKMMSKIDEYKGIIEGSWIAHKPLHSIKILYTAVLSESTEIIEKTAQKTLEIEKTHPEIYPEWSSHYFYSKALANFLLENKQETEKFWEELQVDSYGENFKQSFQAREKFLAGIMYGEEDEVLQSINQILRCHHQEYGEESSTTSDFVSIEATAYVKIASNNGIKPNLEEIDSEHRDYLMEKLL